MSRISYQPLAAEFIGTFALIFVGVGSIAVNQMTHEAGIVGVALAHGLTIAVMASAFGAISGGHFNPAVTAGVLLTRGISLPLAAAYWIVQFLGGIAGALVDKLIFPAPVLSAISLGTPGPANGITAGGAVVMELVLTFFLMLVIFGTAIDPRAPKVGALFIGLTITLDILCGGPLTGAAMNPARALGPAIVSGQLGSVWIYFVGPLLGALAAALYYRFGMAERARSG